MGKYGPHFDLGVYGKVWTPLMFPLSSISQATSSPSPSHQRLKFVSGCRNRTKRKNPSSFLFLHPSVKKLSGWSLIMFTIRTFKVWMDLDGPSLKTKRFDPSFWVSSMISTFYFTEFAVMLTICSHFILSRSYFQQGETQCGFNSCNSGFSFYGFFFFF